MPRKKPVKRRMFLSGQWIPINKLIRQRCCRCGLEHVWRFRVLRNGDLEMMLCDYPAKTVRKLFS